MYMLKLQNYKNNNFIHFLLFLNKYDILKSFSISCLNLIPLLILPLYDEMNIGVGFHKLLFLYNSRNLTLGFHINSYNYSIFLSTNII